MSTIGLFGGSFNPPHVVHQAIALWVVEACEVDTLWMVPAWRHPLHKPMAPFAHRLAMCERAAAPLGARVTVSDIERELGGDSSRTLDTLLALRDRHPDASFRLVVGADILAERPKWHRWDEIERLAPPIVVGRAGYADPAGSLAPEWPGISSTEVRARVARGDSAVPLVSRAVMDYIAREGLYR